MEFTYKAMKANGDVTEGLFVADSKHEVVEMLKSNGSYPISIEEKKKLGTKEITFRRGVSSRELSFFCRQLNAMLAAGSTITKSLDIMKRQVKNGVMHDAIEQMYEDVQQGKVLSESMKTLPRVFPEMMIYMIESGEISGTLDRILLRLSIHFEKEAQLKSKIQSAMVYPIILIVVSIGVVIFMVNFILPTFVSMFEKSDVPLPGITRGLLNFSTFSRNNGLLLTLILGVIGLMIYSYIISDNGRRKFDLMKLRLPVLGPLNRNIMTARFARNLSTMLASGVPLLTALSNLSNIMNNKVISGAVLLYREEIQKGNELHLVVRDSGYFPPMLDGMMEIGKESGTLDDILDKTADYYYDDVENGLQRLVAMFEPMMILVLAVVVGFIVVAMALPMFDMFQTIQ